MIFTPRSYIVEDAFVRRTMFAALVAWFFMVQFSGCSVPGQPESIVVDRAVANTASPAVTAATFDGDGVNIWFDQVMDAAKTLSAVTVLKLMDHAPAQIKSQAVPVEREAVWITSRNLYVSWVLASGSYVVRIEHSALGVSGRPLDGQTGKGQTAGVHRIADDWLDASADYLSLPIYVGEGQPVFLTPPSSPYLTVTEITGLNANSNISPLSIFAGHLWNYGNSRMNALALGGDHLAYRIKFYSPAGGRYALPVPGDVERYVKLVNESNERFGQVQVGLTRLPVNEIPLSYEISGVFGRQITVAAGVGDDLSDVRGSGEPMYLFLGQDASPRVVSAAVIDWDAPSKTFTLSEMARTISGTIFGATVVTERRWLDGELAGGFALRLTDGTQIGILDATDTTLYLDSATTTTNCVGCEVVLVDVSDRSIVGEGAFLTSAFWYFHFDQRPPEGIVQFFSLNQDNLLRSVYGSAFRDLERDGNEAVQPAEADDEFILQVSFRGANDSQPPFSRVNDGLLYPTVFESARYTCLGSSDHPICVREIPDENCTSRKVPVRASFSIYTADGKDGSLGTADLIETESLSSEDVQIFPANSAEPLDTAISTQAVIHSTNAGIFSTTVITVELFHRSDRACGDGVAGRRGFVHGDRLVISHDIRSIATSEPRTLDGDNDGVAQPSVEDDWVGIYDELAQTFLPLVRYPRRDSNR